MPLSKVSYPYPNDTLLVSNLLTTGTTVFSQVSKFAGLINENELGNGLYAGLGPFDNTPRLMFVPPGATTTAGNWQIDAQSAGTFRWFTPGITQMVLSDGRLALGTTPIAATLFALNRSADRVGVIVRGAVGQVSDLEQWQNSASVVRARVDSGGAIYALGGFYANFFANLSNPTTSSYVQYSGNTTRILTQSDVLSFVVFGITGQTANLQEWQINGTGTVSSINNLGAFLAPAATTATPSIRLPHGTAPSAPTNGDIWTTTTGLFVRVNGATVGPLAAGFSNPMTTIGDTIYGAASGTPTRLAGNTTTTRNFLGQTGDGTNSAAPSWTASTGTGSVVLATTPSISGATFTAQLQSTLAWNAADNQGQIYLNGATGNRLDFNNNGSAAPAFTTRSAGTKIVLNSAISGVQVDHAIGIDASTTWFSVPTTASHFFRFYGGTTNTATLAGTGALTLSSSITTGGALNLNYASPAIASNNASAASIFTATVTGVTIGSSTIKTTEYPSEPSGTTSGTVTQAAQLNGYKGMPINARGSAGVALAYTLTASDAGKMIYVSSTPTTPTITIPANSAVAFEIGTTIVVMNDIGAATNVSIAITTDTLQLVSSGAVGTRTLARYGMATLVKVTATKWIITGNGVT